MKKLLANTSLTVIAVVIAATSYAGNKDRSGQAGATELLINPWGATSGVFGSNTALVKGIEAMKGNIAGLSYVEGTEIGLAYNVYLKGTNVSVYNLAFGQRFGNAGVLGVTLQAMNFGDIQIEDFDHPQGGIGTYSPSFFNVQAGFAKEFSHSIHAGIGITFVSEQITNARASGAAFEAGVQYVTGDEDNFHFGVTLRNVGTNMRFTGEGFSFDTQSPGTTGYDVRRQTPSEKLEMPTYLNIATAYDFYLGGKQLANSDDKPKHRLTAMAGFTSNSFNNDYIAAGLEYGFRELFMLRAGYRYEKDISNETKSTTFYKGVSVGASVSKRLSGNGPLLAVDYAFRPTHRPDNGVHNISLRFMLNKRATKAPEAQ